MLIKQGCEICGKEFEAEDWRRRRFCSKKCSATRPNPGQFKEGYKHNPTTEIKRIEAIKKNPGYGMLGKRHTPETITRMREAHKFPYNFIDGGYRNKISEEKCEICNASDKRILVHHKDKNRQNNEINNLMAVCDKCHVHIHIKDRPKKYKIRRRLR